MDCIPYLINMYDVKQSDIKYLGVNKKKIPPYIIIYLQNRTDEANVK